MVLPTPVVFPCQREKNVIVPLDRVPATAVTAANTIFPVTVVIPVNAVPFVMAINGVPFVDAVTVVTLVNDGPFVNIVPYVNIVPFVNIVSFANAIPVVRVNVVGIQFRDHMALATALQSLTSSTSSLSSASFLVSSPIPSEPLLSTMGTIMSISSINTALSTPLHSTMATISLKITSTAVSSATSVSGTNSPQLPPTFAAIVGGVVGAIALLALLIFIVIRCLRKQKLSVTPFNLLPTAGPTRVESQAQKSHSTSGAIGPSSSGSSFIQNPDTCLGLYSGSVSLPDPSYVDRTSSHLPKDYDASASTIARLQRTCELDKLYPVAYPSCIRTSDYCHHSAENWVDQMVTEDFFREPSEELPAYPRTGSAKSVKSSRDNCGFPISSYP